MKQAQDIYWVRYEPRRWLTRLAGLSPEAELAHRRMADFVWAGEGWPSSDPQVAPQLAHVPPQSWPRVLAELRTLGWHTRGSTLFSRGVSNTLSEAHAYSRFLTTRGERAAKARWQGSKPTSAQAMLEHSTSNAKKCTVQYRNSTVQKRLTAERLTRSESPRKKGAKGETEFMADVEATVALFSPDAAPLERTNWGGWWRNRYRESADKAARVLAEVRAMVKEGTIRKTPGAAGVDLWKRLP